jgi:thiosulfate dehydrogenase [quinone] large subunit
MTQELEPNVLGRRWTLAIPETAAGYWLLFLRLLTGWWFLRAGMRKYTTPGAFDAGWFLEKPGTLVSPVLNAFAGGWTEAAVNALVPAGEVLIGLGLLLGLLTRLAAFNATVLLSFFYFGNEAWRRGFVNGDLLGLVAVLTVMLFGAGRIWGVDAALERTSFVRANDWLRYLLA